MLKVHRFIVLLVLMSAKLAAGQDSSSWEVLSVKGAPTAMHEAALVGYDAKVVLIGGRRINPVDVFDPETGEWTERKPKPLEIHHFQGVVLGDSIYSMGAMTGGSPREKPLEKVLVYLPEQDRFYFRHSIPEGRRRGGVGAAYYDGKIYLVGGITNGHIDGSQTWFDEYDPESGNWRQLPDAPRARDHFQAVMTGDRLYAAGGRRTSNATGNLFDLTEPIIDVCDLIEQKWLPEDECPRLPTPRAGNSCGVANGKLIVAGVESGTQTAAHAEVEVYDPANGKWETWGELQQSRHGSGLVKIGEKLYIASGCGNRGGSPELKSIESYLAER